MPMVAGGTRFDERDERHGNLAGTTGCRICMKYSKATKREGNVVQMNIKNIRWICLSKYSAHKLD